ncbi:hypothetical protein VNO77_08019 [Canavalia gladiata]|uniref:Uncharacterized protein n=1 Tax=Canavalia gladiata TaxID=3824 RepID=A0AAN9M855_CANGL
MHQSLHEYRLTVLRQYNHHGRGDFSPPLTTKFSSQMARPSSGSSSLSLEPHAVVLLIPLPNVLKPFTPYNL